MPERMSQDCHRRNIIHPELTTSQEEVDILFKKHFVWLDHKGIMVVSEYTDDSSDRLEKIYVKCGSQARTRHINISKQAISLGDEICEGLLGLDACTECDSLSTYGGLGKLICI